MKRIFLALIAVAFLALAGQVYAQGYVVSPFPSTRSATTVPVFKPSGSGLLAVAHGTITEVTSTADGDIFQMVRVPAGACIVDGFVRAQNLDIGAVALDMDIGWAANGVEAASTAGLGNFGVWNGDILTVSDITPRDGESAVTHGVQRVIRAITTYYHRLAGDLELGPVCFTNETLIQIESNVAAGTLLDGSIFVGVYYYVP